MDPGGEGAPLRRLLWPPRGRLSGADYLELRFLAVAGLTLGALGVASTLTFPLVLGFSPLEFAINAITSVVLATAGVLAVRGHRRASGWILLASVTVAIWAVVLRNMAGPLHDLFVLANVLPILLAFTLRRRWFGAMLAAIAFAYIAAQVGLGRDVPGMMSVAVVLAGVVAVAGIGPLLRRTEERRAAAAEREVHRLLRQLEGAQELAHVGSWELDLTVPGTAVTWSDEMFRLFGRDAATYRPKYDAAFEAVHPDDVARVRSGFEEALRGGALGHEVEHRIVLPDGGVRHVHERVRIVRDAAGRAVRAIGTAQDVTDRHAAEQARADLARQAQELERVNTVARLRADFLNAAAHDLKTPLTPLQLEMATLRLRRASLPPDLQTGLDLLQRNIDRFERLVEDLLDAARLQSGKLRLRRSPTALEPLLRDVVATFADQARASGMELSLRPVPDVTLDVDPAKCVQVLMNLVSNAIRYSPGGGQVAIEAVARPDEVEVQVKDTGLGLSAAQSAGLFQPFGRLHEEQVASGTGLGLYISKGIVEQHGGRIWAESAGPGAGSTFHTTWPRVAGP